MPVDFTKLTAYAVLDGPDGTNKLTVVKVVTYAVLRETPPEVDGAGQSRLSISLGIGL